MGVAKKIESKGVKEVARGEIGFYAESGPAWTE